MAKMKKMKTKALPKTTVNKTLKKNKMATGLKVAGKTKKRVSKKVGTPQEKATKNVVLNGKTSGKRVAKSGAKIPVTVAATSYKLNTGDRCPSFEAPATSGRTLTNRDFTGRPVVLYFYPKDNTPGCTLEGNDFRRLYRDFEKLDCEIIGVSKDSVKSHESFKKKCSFPFELLSDESEAVCRAFDVIHMKSLYGRKYEGIERSTFVVDGKGVVRAEWRKLKVDEHAQEVLEFVKSMK